MMNESNTLSNKMQALAPALPVVMGYLPIGFAYGVLAINAGLSVLETVAMSVIVYAGSAQLMAVSLFEAGINPFSIIATTFIVNLRHLLMSASLAPYMERWQKGQVAAFCYELTDESFGVHSLRFARGETEAPRALAINLTCQLAWVGGTLLGALAGGLITDVKPFALDYALPAMFIALLVLQIKSKRHLLVALIGGALSMVFWLGHVTQWNVILATVLAAAVGAGVETWNKQTQP
jgi:4-azaleucine resistance transporter AzlC